MKIRVSSSLFSFYRRRNKLEYGDSVLHASLHHILLNRGVCVCMLEREMACIYSYVYTHISTYLGAFWWEIFSFDTALLCFVLSQTIKEMIRGFQSKYLTIGKGECGLIEAPFPHFLLSGEGQPRLMQHLHFAGLVPGWNLLLTSPPLLPPPHPRALRVG